MDAITRILGEMPQPSGSYAFSADVIQDLIPSRGEEIIRAGGPLLSLS